MLRKKQPLTPLVVTKKYCFNILPFNFVVRNKNACTKFARARTRRRARALQNSARIGVHTQRSILSFYLSCCQDEGAAAEMGFSFDHYVAFRAQSGTVIFGAAVWAPQSAVTDAHRAQAAAAAAVLSKNKPDPPALFCSNTTIPIPAYTSTKPFVIEITYYKTY